MALGAAALSLAYGAYNAWSSYQSGRENAANIQEQARISASQTRRQGEEQQEQYNAQARALDRQSLSSLMEANESAQGAAEELRQGEISQEKANIEQLKGEREAAKRSRMLAQEIGEQYANYAANGFDVAAGPTDTFGAILRSSVTEGQSDISTILENANMNKWSYEEEKRTHRRSAVSDLASANSSVFKAQSYGESARDYRAAALSARDNAEQTAQETIDYGRSAAKSARRSGIRGAWGSLLQGTIGAVSAFKK